MRTGRLRERATVWSLTLDPVHRHRLGELWVGVTTSKADVDIAPAEGLRMNVPVYVRARWNDLLQPGRYLTASGRRLLVDSVRDPDSRRRDALASCTLLAGEPAQYEPMDGETYPVQARLRRQVAYAGDLTRRSESRLRAQLAWFDLRAGPRRGDHLRIAEREYAIQGVADDADDGVVLEVLLR